MKSMYASTRPCYTCGSTWKIGDEIFKITNGTKDYWCSNPNCRKSKTEAKQETVPQPKEDATLDNVILRENLLLDQIQQAVTSHFTKLRPLAELNGQEVGMRVKEIYRKITG